MSRIPFVDAHVHLWDLQKLRYPWLTPPFAADGPNGSVERIASTYLLDDYRAESAAWNVVGMVHIDAGAHADDAVGETEWLQAIADAHGMPNAIIAFAALEDPDVERLLERHAAHPNVRGIRHIVNWHVEPRRSYTPRDVTLDPAWQHGFGLLAKYGMSFDLQAYPGQFAGLAALIAQDPDIPVMINHMGMPVETDAPGREQWMAGMRLLAVLPNVSVKISGIGFVHNPWTAEQARAYVFDTIEMFGVERAMFASDFPTDRLFGSFDDTLGAYEAIVADFSEDERRALFGRNAARLYRLDLDI